ncbi:hypothetical protein DKX38_001872 [Salix brachista]|uniref:Uncharacterized protein n=1 Tax=Salix brachista TaxID=2182728 RepID=A0A5N5NLK2_9ROSI|nr:hypothetical protein DKX38_001872 [Salix brachista]
MSSETEEAQDSNGTSTMSIVLYVVRSLHSCGGTAPTPTTVEAYKQTEAQVEEGNASALLPTKPCKTEKNCEFPQARLEEWISTLLLPHQLFEEASSYESVEDHKQTEAQVEESRNAQSLPHPVFKKANNCESVEAHKKTEKKVEECTTTLLLPHQLFQKENDDELVEAHKQTEAHAEKHSRCLLLPHEFSRNQIWLRVREQSHPKPAADPCGRSSFSLYSLERNQSKLFLRLIQFFCYHN